jgi:hypothetical protein
MASASSRSVSLRRLLDAKAGKVDGIPKQRGRSLRELRFGGGRSLRDEEGGAESGRRASSGGSRCLCREAAACGSRALVEVEACGKEGGSGLGEEGERLAAP